MPKEKGEKDDTAKLIFLNHNGNELGISGFPNLIELNSDLFELNYSELNAQNSESDDVSSNVSGRNMVLAGC
ncbi:hypothetical protein MRB53_030326 [Persea americana]|uniref:Uncharacterized protein n=1 Tax=Persea americana TaxID=3435 RepID=A0ACC2KM00_PERAE|nr:hypothetical protein MRB53_030326 [Persea americana]